MKRFPQDVRESMERSGATVTCVPVQLDGGGWESAVFFQAGGPECKADRRVLSRASNPLPVEIDTDLIAHDNASVVVLRFEAHTVSDDPLIGEVLLTPGHIPSHHDALKLLTSQPRLCWFFSDEQSWVIHSQQHALGPAHHETFQDLLSEATRQDALIRLTGQYNATHALSWVLSRYELSADPGRTPARPSGSPPSKH